MLVAIHPWDCAGAKEVLLNILQQTWHGGTVEDRCISQQHVYHRHVDAPEFFGASSRYLLWGTVWHFHYWHGAGVIWHGPCMGHLTTRVNAGGIESSIHKSWWYSISSIFCTARCRVHKFWESCQRLMQMRESAVREHVSETQPVKEMRASAVRYSSNSEAHPYQAGWQLYLYQLYSCRIVPTTYNFR